MSMPQKGDPARGWLFVEKLLLDEEIERVEKLSDEDVLAEMGMNASQVPSADRLLRKARARAALNVAKTNGHAVRVNGKAAATPGPAPIAPAPTTRSTRSLLWLLAAAFGLVVAVSFAKRDEVVAFFRGHPAPPAPQAPQQAPSPQQPSPQDQELAAGIRAEARKACVLGDFSTCDSKLAEAKRLDPAGDEAPDVRQLRQALADGLRRDEEPVAKPRPPNPK
jgi:hypothetical protein